MPYFGYFILMYLFKVATPRPQTQVNLNNLLACARESIVSELKLRFTRLFPCHTSEDLVNHLARQPNFGYIA